MATRSVTKSCPKPVLKYRKKARSEFGRLPFVGKTVWDVPTTGGYEGGCELGKWAAIAFLKMLRATDYTGGHLQLIAREMIGQRALEDHSLSGQIVGFFSTLDSYLQRAAKRDDALDGYEEGDLAQAMTRAINFDNKAWLEAISTIEKFNGVEETPFIPFKAYRQTRRAEPSEA